MTGYTNNTDPCQLFQACRAIPKTDFVRKDVELKEEIPGRIFYTTLATAGSAL